jgi:hypothetical protein
MTDPVTATATPARRSGRTLLSRRERHLVNRFSYGVTPQLAKEVKRAGGGRDWWERQLRPTRIRDGRADRLDSWWPSLRRTPEDLWQRQINGVEGGWQVMTDYVRWTLMRRMVSKRQVFESMVDFFEGHLYVPALGDAQFTHRVSYGSAIRRHVLGRFSDLLVATTTHPAMLVYLDAASSTKDHPNENLGRELLELHTVGRAHYTEADVRNSARILTGWSVDMWRSWRPEYHVEDHWRGPVKVLGFSHPNADGDGRRLTTDYLRYLARHPATAQNLARKLCLRFVSDSPSAGLVAALAKVYLAHDTAIVPVLRALVASKEFRRSVGDKVRDPAQDLVATYRVLQAKIDPPPASAAAYEKSAVAALAWQSGHMGLIPFSWSTPDGPPTDNGSWSSPARLLGSMDIHWVVAHGWWPTEGIRYRRVTSWMPSPRMRFDVLVEHLCQQILHRHSNARLLRACATACQVSPREVIGPEHAVVTWRFGDLLATLLDSPDHFHR